MRRRNSVKFIVFLAVILWNLSCDFGHISASTFLSTGDDPTVTPIITPAPTPTPTPAVGCRYVPSQYPSIQIAIEASVDGDTVYVAPGVYRGDSNTDLKFGGRAIHLTSFPGEPTPVIDCMGTDSNYHQGFIFNSLDGPGLEVSNMAVINGFYGLGGGMWFLPGSAPVIRNCLIRDCTAEWSGGGIQAFSSGVILNRVDIENCVSIDGGGGAACFQGGHDSLQPIMYRCIIKGNQCYGGNFGVVQIDSGSELVITSCEFIDNVKSALWFNSGHMHFLDVNNCLFSGNTVGMTIQTGMVDIDCSTFNDNHEYAITAYEKLTQVDLIRSCLWGPNDLAHNISSAQNCNLPDPNHENYSNCFYADPLFVQGASGDYYIYQREYSEPSSPNFNTGGKPVWLIQFPGPGYNVLMENMTTSVNHVPDTRFTDIGYHYTIFDGEPTPKPPPERPVIEDILGCTEDFTNNKAMTYHISTLLDQNPDGIDIVSVELYWGNFPIPWELVDNGTCGDAVAGDGRYSRLLTFTSMWLPDYEYELSIVAIDAEGGMSIQMPYVMSVENPNSMVVDSPVISGRYVWYEPVTPGEDEDGFLWILIKVDHPGGLKQVSEVRVMFEGVDTGLRLFDIGSQADLAAGDGFYGAMLMYNGLEIPDPVSVIMDVEAVDADGVVSRSWPVAWKTRSYME
ncbi:right-handed parallel beta-helix repeat-containing protein [bacterium]|nr:right-handed parallel beta-helix repeat-containing protein [bacterium]